MSGKLKNRERSKPKIRDRVGILQTNIFKMKKVFILLVVITTFASCNLIKRGRIALAKNNASTDAITTTDVTKLISDTKALIDNVKTDDELKRAKTINAKAEAIKKLYDKKRITLEQCASELNKLGKKIATLEKPQSVNVEQKGGSGVKVPKGKEPENNTEKKPRLTVTFLDTAYILNENPSEPKLYKIEYTLSGDFKEEDNLIIEPNFSNGISIANQNDYYVVNNEVKITSKNTDGKVKLNFEIVVLNDTVNETIPEYIKLNCNTSKYDCEFAKPNSITIKNNQPFNPITPYKFYLGSNFDFGEKLVPNSLYSEVNIALFDLINKSDYHNNRKYMSRGVGGIFAIYRNKSISQDSSVSNGLGVSNYYTKISEGKVDSVTKSIGFKTERATQRSNTTFSNIGLYCQPTFTLKKTESVNIFLLAHLEVIQRRTTTTYSYSNLLNTDTVTIKYTGNLYTNDDYADFRALNRPKYEVLKSTQYEFVTSLGIGFQHNSKIGQINWKSSWGYYQTRYSGASRINNGLAVINQFNFIEDKTGLTLSGEIRNYFTGNNEPLISISLSKAFNISELAKFLVKN